MKSELSRGAVLAAGFAVMVTLSAPALAAACATSGNFGAFLSAFKQEAIASGISKATVNGALADVAFDQGIIDRDHKQGVFNQSFLEFSGRMVNAYRIQQGGKLAKKYANVFARAEKSTGVPAPVITALWALETDFGADSGDLPTLRSLATLAFDCRRPEIFRKELLAALSIIDSGDLAPEDMRGAWAGELGQTQFLPSYYAEVAVDGDGDGRRDLIHSQPDVIASTANLLKFHGWQAGEPWLREVSVPANMPWEEADIAIVHPTADWAKWGVAGVGGKLLPDGPDASLLLPMGRLGPAFLAYPNYQVFLKWNQSFIYSTTAAYLATRIAGAPALGKGRGGLVAFPANLVSPLQKILAAKGHDVGTIDGKLGAGTRNAVRKVQLELGLPADAYPTLALMQKLKGGG